MIKLVILFLILNMIDILLTNVSLSRGGVELNPIVNYFINKDLFWAYKILTSVGVVLVLLKLKHKHILIALCIAMGLICAWNIIALFSWR